MVRAETWTEACEPALGALAPCTVLSQFVLKYYNGFMWLLDFYECLSIFLLEAPLFPFAPMFAFLVWSFV